MLPTQVSRPQVGFPFKKGYAVFNLDQVEGLPDSFLPLLSPTPSAFEPNQVAESFFAKTGATFRQGGDRAFYSLLGHWPRVLKADKRAIFTVAFQAHRA